MNDKKDEQVTRPGVDFVVKRDRFEKIDLKSMLSCTTSVDCYDLHRIIADKMDAAKSELQEPLQILVELANYRVTPDHATEPFKPMIMYDQRSLVRGDFRSEQLDVLEKFAPKVSNAGLRARIADVVWFVDRKRNNLADLAISSYCECLDQVRAGDATFAFNDHSPWGGRAIALLIRAARISFATKWRLRSSKRLRKLISDLVSTAYKGNKPEEFVKIANVDIDYQISSLKDIATWSENLAGSDILQNEPDQRTDLWKIAARCYQCMRDDENRNRCKTEVAECYVQRATLANSLMVEADFLQDAIEVLQERPGTKKRRDVLMGKLRLVQRSIGDEMGSFSVEIDSSDAVKNSVASVKGHSWPTAFLSLILCECPPQPDALLQAAKNLADNSPLFGMSSGQVYDFQGRVIFRSPGLYGEARDKELHYLYLMSLLRGFERLETVVGVINPIRRVICEEHFVSADVIHEMIKDSPYIPPEHCYIFARAIVQFLAGEDVEATSLLVPQLENSLRHILARQNIHTSTDDDNGTQTEVSLSLLLNPDKPWRARLEKIISKRYVNEIDLLLNSAGGPSLRNQVAHGKVSVTDFLHHNMVYASWLTIQIVVLPLVERWGNGE